MKVTVVSYTNGSVPRDHEGDSLTPASIASEMGISLANVTIHVDEAPAQANHNLRDGDLVTFQKEKVSSGC